MSWMKGGERQQPYVEGSTDKIADPFIPNRMVSNKKANRPFLACVCIKVIMKGDQCVSFH